ncbi:TrkA C-terminal domain-containing protein [Mangrovitalea sediminis]|uniref:TrkA C-terminal domain-containing protein n=1 Tax=Mangrovitalea sediminis TaxID=1982043 RepID=UPI000BE4B1E9|nr:TrkA C-terminal domain-containing protein [Mangrovitalea sediminis]
MIPLLSLVIVLLLSITVTRIATIVLVHTGLSLETARFQARSAFTGAGFTTQESEQVVNHPVRRRVIMWLMLFGNAGIVSVIASVILTFINFGEAASGSLLWKLLLAIGGLMLVIWFTFSRWLRQRMSVLVDHALARITDLDVRDYINLLHLDGEYRLIEMVLEEDDWLAGRTLSEARPRSEGIVVLGLRRRGKGYIGTPSGDTTLQADDTLLLYGRQSALARVDQRRKGWTGDIEHREAVEEQLVVAEQEAATLAEPAPEEKTVAPAAKPQAAEDKTKDPDVRD